MPRHERQPSASQPTLEEAFSRQQIRAVRWIVGVAIAALIVVAAIIAVVLVAGHRTL